SAFPGTWLNTNQTAGPVYTIEIKPGENGSLSVTFPGGTKNVTFDGTSARRLRAGAIEGMRRTNGQVTQTQQLGNCPGLKTLTITTRTVGVATPSILVFTRQ